MLRDHPQELYHNAGDYEFSQHDEIQWFSARATRVRITFSKLIWKSSNHPHPTEVFRGQACLENERLASQGFQSFKTELVENWP